MKSRMYSSEKFDLESNNAVKICKSKIGEQFPASKNRILQDEPMSEHSSFQVGGIADLAYLPSSSQELLFAVKCANESQVPVTILGNGSNVLVSDKGIRGLVIILGRDYSHCSLEAENIIIAESGALLASVAKFAAKKNLTGIEFAAGIPGSIGGAVYMNAGAYDGCMADIVSKSEAFDPSTGKVFIIENVQDHKFGYRQSVYEENKYIVLRTWITLEKGDLADIEKKMAEFSVKRKASQPLEFPSAGSTFKRPTGYYAGKLIEDAGLKGCRVGGACVSMKHAGFIINDNNATAKDIRDLIDVVTACVFDKYGVKIDTEVRILGEW